MYFPLYLLIESLDQSTIRSFIHSIFQPQYDDASGRSQFPSASETDKEVIRAQEEMMAKIVDLLGAKGLLSDVRDLLNEKKTCYSEPFPKLLMAAAGTDEQSIHYDYTLRKQVPALESDRKA